MLGAYPCALPAQVLLNHSLGALDPPLRWCLSDPECKGCHDPGPAAQITFLSPPDTGIYLVGFSFRLLSYIWLSLPPLFVCTCISQASLTYCCLQSATMKIHVLMKRMFIL